MKVTVKNWHAVASWTWTTEDDGCGICHMPLDGCAPNCAGPGDDSPVVWGRVRRPPRPTPRRALLRHARHISAPFTCIVFRSASTTSTSCASRRGLTATRTRVRCAVASGSSLIRTGVVRATRASLPRPSSKPTDNLLRAGTAGAAHLHSLPYPHCCVVCSYHTLALPRHAAPPFVVSAPCSAFHGP